MIHTSYELQANVMDSFDCPSVDPSSIEANLTAALRLLKRKFPKAKQFDPTMVETCGRITRVQLKFLLRVVVTADSMADADFKLELLMRESRFRLPRVISKGCWIRTRKAA